MKMKLVRIISAVLFVLLLSPCVFAAENAETVFEDITKNDIYAAVYEADIVSLRSALDCGLITSRELTGIYLDSCFTLFCSIV